MAISTICPLCKGTSFELAFTPVKGANFDTLFIRCSNCGCAISAHESHNISTLIFKLAEKLNIDLKN